MHTNDNRLKAALWRIWLAFQPVSLNIFGALLGFAVVTLTARVTDLASFGVVSYLLSITGFVTPVIVLGTGNDCLRKFAAAYENHSIPAVRSVMLEAFGQVAFTSSLSLVFAIGFFPFAPRFLDLHIGDYLLSILLAFEYAVAAIFQTWFVARSQYSRGLLLFQMIRMIAFVGWLGIAYSAGIRGMEVRSIMYIYAATAAIPLVVAAASLGSVLQGGPKKSWVRALFSAYTAAPRSHMKTGWLSAQALLDSFKSFGIFILLGYLLLPEELGLVRIASLLAGIGSMALLTFERSRSAQLSRELASEDLALQRTGARIAAVSLAWSMSFVVGLVVIGPTVIAGAFGAEFSPAWLPAVILAGAAVVQSGLGPNGMIFYLAYREKALFVINTIWTSLIALGFLAFSPAGGALATVIVLGTGTAAFNVTMWAYIYLRLDRDLSIAGFLRARSRPV